MSTDDQAEYEGALSCPDFARNGTLTRSDEPKILERTLHTAG